MSDALVLKHDYLSVGSELPCLPHEIIHISPDQLLAESATPGGAGKTTTSTVLSDSAATKDDAWFLRDAIFDRVGEVYTDDVVAIVADWLATYERAGCSLGDAEAELDATRDDGA